LSGIKHGDASSRQLVKSFSLGECRQRRRKMGLISGIWLMVLGVLGAANLIIARKPSAKELIGKIAPYQGWIGVISAFWGIWGIINAVLSLGWLAYMPIYWATFLGASVLQAILGILLGIGTMKTFIKQPQAVEKLDLLVTRMAPKQGVLGFIAIGTGAWMILAGFFFMSSAAGVAGQIVANSEALAAQQAALQAAAAGGQMTPEQAQAMAQAQAAALQAAASGGMTPEQAQAMAQAQAAAMQAAATAGAGGMTPEQAQALAQAQAAAAQAAAVQAGAGGMTPEQAQAMAQAQALAAQQAAAMQAAAAGGQMTPEQAQAMAQAQAAAAQQAAAAMQAAVPGAAAAPPTAAAPPAAAGTAAKALVQQVWAAGVDAQQQPLMGIDLYVYPPAGTPYQVRLLQFPVPVAKQAMVAPQATINVSIDPANPMNVTPLL
jgi:hypothetical protein